MPARRRQSYGGVRPKPLAQAGDLLRKVCLPANLPAEASAQAGSFGAGGRVSASAPARFGALGCLFALFPANNLVIIPNTFTFVRLWRTKRSNASRKIAHQLLVCPAYGHNVFCDLHGDALRYFHGNSVRKANV